MKSICLLAVLLLHAAPARGDEEARWMMIVPEACEGFAGGESPDHPMYWDRRLSLATCVQDSTIAAIDSPVDVAPMMIALSAGLAPSMLIWRDALEHAPPVTQLRAAYGVGSAAIALMTRARSSLIVSPAMSERDGRAQLVVLRSRLEPLLAPARKIAWSSFTVLDSIERESPELALDPVHAAMFRSAKMWLQALEHPADERIQLADE
jgi:hypothetical protein